MHLQIEEGAVDGVDRDELQPGFDVDGIGGPTEETSPYQEGKN